LQEGTVVRWRKAFGVARTDPEGSRRMIQAAAQAGGDAVRERDWTEEEKERRRQNALKNNLAQYFTPGSHGPLWTAKQLALLGTLADGEVASRIGRTTTAVRVMRQRLGIPNTLDRRRRR